MPRQLQRLVRVFIALALLFTAPSAFSQTDEAPLQSPAEARKRLNDCINSIDDEDTFGLDALEEVCPGLEQILEELGFMPFLSDQQLDQLNLDELHELLGMASRYGGDAAGRGPGLDSLDSVLDEMEKQHAEQPLTLGQRFKRWLRSLWERQQSDGDPWLTQWLSEHQLSEAMRQGLLIAVTTLIVVLALVVVINELRASGVLRKRQGAAVEGNAVFDGAPIGNAGPVDLDAAAPGERPSLLLRMLVATLVKTGRLRAERSLTHRELGMRATFDDAQQRECFERVAELAERVVYGHGRLQHEDLESIVHAGRTLNDKLTGAPA